MKRSNLPLSVAFAFVALVVALFASRIAQAQTPPAEGKQPHEVAPLNSAAPHDPVVHEPTANASATAAAAPADTHPTVTETPTTAHPAAAEGTVPGHGAAPSDHETAHGTATGAAAHPPAAPGEHAAGHDGEHHGPGPINWVDISNKKQPPYIALVFNFALLVFIYVKYGKKPIQEGLAKRRENVAKQIEEASRIKAEAEERAKKYQSQLAHLDEEAAQAKATIRTTGEADRDRVLREANEKAARMERDADTMLEAERKAAKRELYEEAVNAAVKRAEDLLRAKLTQADHDRLAEDFLTQLAAHKPAGARAAGGAAAGHAPPMNKVGDT